MHDGISQLIYEMSLHFAMRELHSIIRQINISQLYINYNLLIVSSVN